MKPDNAAAVALETTCPRCGRPMSLPLPPDTDRADAERLARLVLCDACTAGTGPLPVEWQDVEFAVPVRTASDNVKASIYAGHLDHNPSEPEANSDLAVACTRSPAERSGQRAGHRRLHREGATRPCLPEERGALKLGGNASYSARPMPDLPTPAALVSSPAMPPHPQQGIYSEAGASRLPGRRGLSL